MMDMGVMEITMEGMEVVMVELMEDIIIEDTIEATQL